MDFILVNYNNSRLSIGCVRSISDSAQRIIVADNASRPVERQLLEKFQQSYKGNNLQMLYLEKNLGYTGAINAALKQLPDKGYVTVGNNDLEYSPTFAQDVTSFPLPEKVQIIAPNIVKTNGVHQNPYQTSKASWLYKAYLKLLYSGYQVGSLLQQLSAGLSIGRSGRDRKGFERSAYIRAGHGACYVLTPNFWKHHQGLDESSFLFGEEFLIARQVEQSGGKIYYLANAIVSHHEHATMKKVPSHQTYELRQKAYRLTKEYI